MNKTHASLLLVALCTGLILAGCQKPAATNPAAGTNTQAKIDIKEQNTAETTGSMTIVPPTETKASMAITAPGTDANATTPAATDAAEKAAVEAKGVTP
jgi:hypothetical protein